MAKLTNMVHRAALARWHVIVLSCQTAASLAACCAQPCPAQEAQHITSGTVVLVCAQRVCVSTMCGRRCFINFFSFCAVGGPVNRIVGGIQCIHVQHGAYTGKRTLNRW